MEAAGPLVHVLETLALERLPGGVFVLCEDAPPWTVSLGWLESRRGEPFGIDRLPPFVEAFLPDAERVWAGPGAARVDSGYWTETTAGGEELALEATALRACDRALLLVTRCDPIVSERRRILQRAREIGLAHDALSREIERKDVLIHCIVHDLRGPLNSILGTLSLFSEQPLPPPSAAMIQVALKAALRQRQLISEILDIFAAERGALEDVRADVAAPDLRAAVALVVEAFLPMATSLGVRLVGPSDAGPPCAIIGDERRLVRVLVNLVQNAIGFSPRGGTVRVLLSEEQGGFGARAVVEDEGPGVPPDLVPHLFQKFFSSARPPKTQRSDPGAGSGLGLYFCRITVEHWGGAIGHEPRPGGGARFWIRLRRADAPPERGSAPGTPPGGATARTGEPWPSS